MRESVLEAPELSLADVYPAIREAEMKYDGQTLALPLGSPPLMLCWGMKEGSDASANPPPTWEDYRQVLGVGTPDATAAALPLADHAAAFTLIARALAYTESHRRAEALFDPENMAPRIAEAPWVRALNAVVEERQTQSDQSAMSFAQAVMAVMSGQSPATLGWPSLLNQDDDTHAADSGSVMQFAPLPTAEQIYSTTRQDWENQLHPQPVTLLGVEGRLVAVTQASRNAVSAFKLAQWLTSGDVAVQLSSRSRGTLWYRKSQASAYTRWTGGELTTGDATPVTQRVAELLETENPILVPRVPGVDEYLNELSEAVRSATPGEQAARQSLEAVAAKWDQITERLGREAQARAYRRHLGIEALER
jgi:ABC-type glycerol-3-phosphate transport system substrate-binding protein